MVTRTCLALNDYTQYQKRKNESWRRMPKNLTFSYDSGEEKESIFGQNIRTVDGQAIEIVGENQTRIPQFQTWKDEFLYQSLLPYAYGLKVMLTNGTYQWFDGLSEGKLGRYLLVIKAGHEVDLCEQSELTGSLKSLDIIVEKGGVLRHFQTISASGNSFDHVNVVVEEGGRYQQNYAQSGGGSYRRSQRVLLVGQNAVAKIEGMNLALAKEVISEHVGLYHLAEKTQSYHTVSTLLHEGAKVDVFSTVDISSEGQQSLSRQKIEHLLLSENSRAFSKPALNVSIDDVDCQHGATMGMLDESLLVYLYSRGLDINMAKQLYLSGYMEKLFTHEKAKRLKAYLYQRQGYVDG